MNGLSLFCFRFIACALAACSLGAGELWVDQAAPAGGDGSAEAPFHNIESALKKVQPGGTVTVRAGVYRESLRLMQGSTADQPTTLQAADGERVVLSGFREVAGWEKLDAHPAGQVFTAVVDHPVHDLYVHYIPQQVARVDGEQSHWFAVESADAKAGSVTVGEALWQAPGIDAAANDTADVLAFHHYLKSNRAYTDRVTAIDPGQRTLKLEGDRIAAMGNDDVLTLINHPAFIDRPGEWARKKLDDKRTQIFFWPRDPADLSQTRSRFNPRAMLTVGHWSDRIGHVKVSGFEIAGSLGSGVEVHLVDGVEVSDCIVHNNAKAGIQTRNSSHARIARNVVFGNLNGIVAISTPDALIAENEVCFNYADGIDVVGDISQKGREPNSDRPVVRRNYMHHHFLLEHPDNLQFYFGSDGAVVRDNLALHAMQGMMSQDVQGGTFSNNLFFGAGGMVLIFGHGTSTDWSIQHNTLGFGGWGAMLMTGDKYQIDHNIFFNNPHGGTDAYQGDHNLLWNTDPGRPVLMTGKPDHRKFQTVAEFTQATGKETHSLRADPQFANVPKLQAVVTRYEECTAEMLLLRQVAGQPTDGFAEGDTIEINGDGIARRVTRTTAEAIHFSPPLPEAPFRTPIVWNWGDRDDLNLDFTPASTGPAFDTGMDSTRVGATINVAHYQAGDFDGDGQRDLPALPDDVARAIPDPNAPALPPTLP